MKSTSALSLTPHPSRLTACERIRVRGQVQGVGFRPFVYRLAGELGLAGWVRNDADGVEIEAQGGAEEIESLLARLKDEAPALARVDEVSAIPAEKVPGRSDFAILESRAGHAHTGIAPDAAICPDCLAEICDPADRRYRYAFTNCTNCGPRYTITRHLPYDRPHTSMAGFALCPACRREYDDPLDRRFHAQPNACPACGPKLTLLDKNGVDVAHPIAATVERLRAGQIIAIKGIGGFHLMCDAHNPEAVARLRQRKQREEKPFAVMLAGIASVAPLAACGEAEQALLEARERPIVLLRKRDDCDAKLPGVAPGMSELGVLLPYAPLHYLLFHEAAGRPQGTAWLAAPQQLALVCTSANPGDEPLVTGNDEALARLADIADAFLLHDREILVRCDDSVVRSETPSPLRGEGWGEGASVEAPASPAAPHPNLLPEGEKGRTALARLCFVRRARGYTPRAIKLAQTGRPVLAVGGWFKNTVCLTRGDEAFLSQHIGDLDHAATCRSLEEVAHHLMDVLEIEPEIVAHDRHPDFFSTRFAVDFAGQHGIPVLPVQHHHAHIAAVLAEHGVSGPVLGLALDGVGLGTDGAAWGGELLRVEGAQFQRLAHLNPLALPGGDRAAREPWRMAASALHALGRGAEIERRFAHPAGAAVRQMLERNVNSPATSSCGRLFDAAAGLLGVRDAAAFEGQAAMLLEGLADAHGPVSPLEHGYTLDALDSRLRGNDRVKSGPAVLNLLPLLAALSEIRDAGYGAALFHATLSQALAAWVEAALEKTGLNRVVFGGGCFLNRLLCADLGARLAGLGVEVYQARQAPPNDGGLSLGQAWVAMSHQSSVVSYQLKPTDELTTDN
ncbi:MAG: carbamoyltransferase HypF [Sulfuricella sp.]|nr:carbamoyltransferase HypF [Sulfuricella sp.]